MDNQNDNTKKEQKPGRAWDINGRFETFTEADQRRNSLLSREDNQCDIKVRHLSVGKDRWAFFVKTRLKEKYVRKNDAKKKLSGKNKKQKKSRSTKVRN